MRQKRDPIRFLSFTRRLVNLTMALGLFVFPALAAPVPENINQESKSEHNKAMQNSSIDELLKNYLASMSYSPQAVALPADPVIYPTVSPDFTNTGILPGSDADMELPEIPFVSTNKVVKVTKTRRLNFMKPVVSAILSSPFGLRWGRMHEGVDLAVSQGTAIVATEAGKITYSGWVSGYGNFISMDHGGSYTSRYGHASALLVRAGQQVKKGQLIALVGSTGHSTGPHLHFELISNGKHQNPLTFINKSVQITAL